MIIYEIVGGLLFALLLLAGVLWVQEHIALKKGKDGNEQQ